MRKLGRAWFERRVARILGMDAELARELLGAAHGRHGRRFALRSAAFLLVTTPLSTRIVPRRLRERAVAGFVWWLFEDQVWQPHIAVAYAGRDPGLLAR